MRLRNSRTLIVRDTPYQLSGWDATKEGNNIMDTPSPTIIDRVRQLMPMRTLDIISRPLKVHEARIVAERQADLLLRLLRITQPSVEIELIAELPTINVEVSPNLPLSGYSVWQGDHWHIHINADDSLWRCRSTLAHELKHILDDPFREQLYPDWPRDSQLPPPTEAEEICDYFAGCVLAPTAWLQRVWQHGIRDTAKLASLFDVSESLIKVRLHQTGLTVGRLRNYPRRSYTRRPAWARVTGTLSNQSIKHQLAGVQL